MSAHRKDRQRMGPERPFAVIMLAAAVMVGAGRWFMPGEVGTAEIVLRVLCGLLGLLGLAGAVSLWRMGGRR